MQQLGDRVLELFHEALAFMWNFAIAQLVALFNQPWQTLPWWKGLLVLLVIVVMAFALWSYLLSFARRLLDAFVSLLYALVCFFGLGLAAYGVNWFLRVVPNTALAL